MKLLFAVAILCICSGVQARTAFQARCEDTIGQSVSVLTSTGNGYRIDNTYSFHGLSAMKGDRTPGSYVLGLTRTESRVGLKVQGRMLSDPASGYECVAPRLDITLSYLPIVVYIGREFAPGTCSYREILAHEMRHLSTYLSFMPQAERPWAMPCHGASRASPCTPRPARRATCCSVNSIAAGCPSSRTRW